MFVENNSQKYYNVIDLLRFLCEDDVVVGEQVATFSNITNTANVNMETLDLIHPKNTDPIGYMKQTLAKVIIAPIDTLEDLKGGIDDKTIIFTANPKLLYTRIADELFVEKPAAGVHPSAVIDSNALIGNNVYIGPLCSVGKCEIGDNSIIHSHVSIENNTKIGRNVIIKNGARIGQTGFGFVKNENGEYEKFPQVGKVIIKDNVEIGANTCIDRGALCDTIIGKGTKIDNQVQIAHNVQIGEHCIITGNVSVGGSVQIGNFVWIGPGAIINNGLIIGHNVFINMGSVVIKNVKDNKDIIGYPAEDKLLYVKKRHALYKIYKERNKE